MIALKFFLPAVFCLLATTLAHAQRGDRKGHVMESPPDEWNLPAPVLEPESALESFQFGEPGFELEIVAAEPLVINPVCVAFDGNGRPWVCEMRSYMPDIDGKGEDGRLGRISILEDTDGDGRADAAKVFLDGLLLPRAIQFADGGVLWADQQKLHFTKRVGENGDQAGQTRTIDEKWAPSGNVEHKANGLVYGLDNWLYNAKSDARYRKIDGKWVKDKVGYRGQWGIAQDDFGRLATNSNSNLLTMETIAPGYLKANPNHGFRARTATKIDNRVWPIRITCGVNRGYMGGTLTGAGFLAKATGACGLTIYRGDNFPAEYRGNAFIPEPCGLLVKRAIFTENDGVISAKPAYEGREFLASLDERNRFVNAYTAPDGTLYLVDIYHGIIQHKTYVTTYLRQQLVHRGLDRNNNDRGRIYRVRWGEKNRGSLPQMLSQPSADLVAHLDHLNGWWRDTAQRLIVQRGDVSCVPALRKNLRSAGTLGRIHALWSLEGLGELSVADLETAAASRDPKLLATAARVARVFAGTDHEAAAAQKLASVANKAPGPEAARYLAATLAAFRQSGKTAARETLTNLLARGGAEDPLFRDMLMSGLGGAELDFAKLALRGHPEFVRDLLVPAIVNAGNVGEIEQLLAVAKDFPDQEPQILHHAAKTATAKRNAAVATVLLDIAQDETVRKPILEGILSGGKTKGFKKIRLKRVPAVLSSAESTSDQRLAAVANLFDLSSHVEKNHIRTAEDKRQFALGQAEYAKLCIACHQANGQGLKPLAPPLVDSEWVTGPERRLIALTMEGMMGPITVNGTLYQAPDIQPVMPGIRSNPEIDDEKLAAILTYVRNAWGNRAPPVSAKSVAKWRKKQPARAPFSEAEARSVK